MSAIDVDGLIMFAVGLCITYLAWRGVPAGTTRLGEWQHWYRRYGTVLKCLGPLLMLFGLEQTAIHLIG